MISQLYKTLAVLRPQTDLAVNLWKILNECSVYNPESSGHIWTDKLFVLSLHDVVLLP